MLENCSYIYATVAFGSVPWELPKKVKGYVDLFFVGIGEV